MKARDIAVLVTVFLLLMPVQTVVASGWFSLPDEPASVQDVLTCDPPVHTSIAARLYSYQVPVLIRNEMSPEETKGAYANACTKAPENWVPGQWIDSGLREGKTWASFAVYQDPAKDAWQPTFPPDETLRNMYDADAFKSFSPSIVYSPLFGPFQGLNPPVSLTDVPQTVNLGVSQSLAKTLQDAGMIVENDRVWAEYSADPLAREGRNESKCSNCDPGQMHPHVGHPGRLRSAKRIPSSRRMQRYRSNSMQECECPRRPPQMGSNL